jgi:hypothetical protein
MIDVWARRRNSEQAVRLVASLQAEGHDARESNAAYFGPSEIDPYVVKVYHDGTVVGIGDVCKARGIPCELIPGMDTSRVEHMPPPDGYEVVYRAPWYSVVGPEGKVGKSVRTEEEAQEILRSVTDGHD